MKQTIEYLKELFEEPFELVEDSIEKDFYLVIRKAQEEAIRETVKMCANAGSLLYCEYEFEIPEGAESNGSSEYGYSYVDINKILSVANKLIKEL